MNSYNCINYIDVIESVSLCITEIGDYTKINDVSIKVIKVLDSIITMCDETDKTRINSVLRQVKLHFEQRLLARTRQANKDMSFTIGLGVR